MNVFTRILTSGAAIATLVTLSGCSGAGIDIASTQGVGVCGSDAVMLDVTQDSAADNITITYDGPSDVSLVAYQGLYSDSEFYGLLGSESYAFGYPFDTAESPADIAFNALDLTDSEWTVTTTGDTMNAVYSDSIVDFIANASYTATSNDSNEAVYDSVLPWTVAVRCGDGFTSVVADSPTRDSEGVLEDFEFAVAQPFFPNFMYVDAPTISRQSDIENGIHGRLTLPADLAAAFPDDFIPAGIMATATYIGERDPMLPPNDEYPFTLDGANLGDLWLITLLAGEGGGSSTTVEFTSSYSMTEPMEFDFTGESSAPSDGYYLFTFIVTDDEMSPDRFKFASAVMRYTAEDGVVLRALDEAPEAERLAPTGGDPNAFIWAILGALVVLGAVALRPKRRADQDASTSEPSDKKK